MAEAASQAKITADLLTQLTDDDEALKLLTSGREIALDSVNAEGASILYIVSSNGWKKCASHLLELPNIDVQLGVRGSKDTPLHIAVEKGQAQIVQGLVRYGADVNKSDDNDQTPLHTAVFHSHLKTVKYLLKKGAKCNVADKDGALPIHLAAYVGHTDIILALLEEPNTNPNETDLDGCTPLSFAVDQGFIPAVNLLLSHGADLRSDLNGDTPIHKAVASDKPEMLQVLLDKLPKDKVKSSVDESNLQGLTPLMVASVEGFDNCVKVLLGVGASPNIADTDKSTALHMAAFNGHTKAVEMLTERNAEITARDSEGNTPFHKAAEGGSQTVLAVLARKSVEPNALSTTNKQGTTPLMMACSGGHIECVRILLMFSDPENISKTDKSGYNALHMSAAQGKDELVRTLLQHPNAIFDVDQGTGDKYTPLTLALKNKHIDTARILAAFGANFVLDKEMKRKLRHIQEDKLKEIAVISHAAQAEGVRTRRGTISDRDGSRHSMRKRRTTDRKNDVTAMDFTPPTATASSAPTSPEQPTSSDQAIKSSTVASLSPVTDKKKPKSAANSPRRKAARNMSTSATTATSKVFTRENTKKRNTSTSSADMPAARLPVIKEASKSVGDMNSLVDDLLSDLVLEDSDSDSAGSSKNSSSAQLKAPSNPSLETQVKSPSSPTLDAAHGKPSASNPTIEVTPAKSSPKSPATEAKPGKERTLSRQSSIKVAPTKAAADALLKEAVMLFATKPQKAIDMLIDGGVVEDNCSMVANFLFENDIFNKTSLGDWLSDRHEFNVSVLEVFVEKFDWLGLEFDTALRRFLQKFRLPGEAQKIDRIMEAFARQFFKQNPKSDKVVFANQDAVYVLAFSTIMLNTDLHNPNIKPQNKMTKPQFVKNNTKINGGDNFPDAFIENLYERIRDNEIKMDSEKEELFSDAEIKGWLTKQGGRIKTWKKRWFALKENCLFYFKTEKDKEPAGIIPLEDLVVSANRKYKNSFELSKPVNSGPIKATARKGEGMVMADHDTYIFQAESQQQCQQWIDCINRNIFKNPIHQLMAVKRQQQAN